VQGPTDPASSSRAWAGIESSDIRYDEDYARFYEVFSGQRKLPPPVEGRTLYSELGLLQQQQKQMLAQHQGMLTSATPPPSQAALLGMGGALTPGGTLLLPLRQHLHEAIAPAAASAGANDFNLVWYCRS
jgi:hypothetical protein